MMVCVYRAFRCFEARLFRVRDAGCQQRLPSQRSRHLPAQHAPVLTEGVCGEVVRGVCRRGGGSRGGEAGKGRGHDIIEEIACYVYALRPRRNEQF